MTDISPRKRPLLPLFPERTFRLDGKVSAVLPGCSMATIDTGGLEEVSVDRTTDGLRFEELRVGQRVSCEVAPNRRVVRAQLTQPVAATMTKEEFAAEYCRRWGVTWADISRHRVVVPSSTGIGWEMANARVSEEAPTVHGGLEPL